MKVEKGLELFLLAGLVSRVYSSPVSFCPDSSDVCFRWGVPDSRVLSKNIYLQIEAPISYQWIGLGIGKQMAGAVMFLMYEDGTGNVTISNREGKSHSMPQAAAQDNIALLSGSGVKDGKMIANVCYNNPGGLSLSGSSDWIMAKKEGVSLSSTDPNESITVHDSHTAFSVNLDHAFIPSDSNPFIESNGEGNGTSNGTSNDASGVTHQNNNSSSNLILAHGVILSVVFVAIYPLGSLLMPLTGKWYIHAGWQMIGFLGMWAGFGIGYIVSCDLDIFFDQAHTRLGVIIVALLGLQPILGLLHHLQYRQQRKRGAFGHFHIWYGRATIIIGIVNGGLGLQLSGASNVFIIVYSIFAAVAAILYAGYSTFKLVKTEKTGKT